MCVSPKPDQNKLSAATKVRTGLLIWREGGSRHGRSIKHSRRHTTFSASCFVKHRPTSTCPYKEAPCGNDLVRAWVGVRNEMMMYLTDHPSLAVYMR